MERIKCLDRQGFSHGRIRPADAYTGRFPNPQCRVLAGGGEVATKTPRERVENFDRDDFLDWLMNKTGPTNDTAASRVLVRGYELLLPRY